MTVTSVVAIGNQELHLADLIAAIVSAQLDWLSESAPLIE
jgi:hypothetical protein